MAQPEQARIVGVAVPPPVADRGGAGLIRCNTIGVLARKPWWASGDQCAVAVAIEEGALRVDRAATDKPRAADWVLSVRIEGANFGAAAPLTGTAVTVSSLPCTVASSDGLSWSHGAIKCKVAARAAAPNLNGSVVVTVGGQSSAVHNDATVSWQCASGCAYAIIGEID